MCCGTILIHFTKLLGLQTVRLSGFPEVSAHNARIADIPTDRIGNSVSRQWGREQALCLGLLTWFVKNLRPPVVKIPAYARQAQLLRLFKYGS